MPSSRKFLLMRRNNNRCNWLNMRNIFNLHTVFTLRKRKPVSKPILKGVNFKMTTLNKGIRRYFAYSTNNTYLILLRTGSLSFLLLFLMYSWRLDPPHHVVRRGRASAARRSFSLTSRSR